MSAPLLVIGRTGQLARALRVRRPDAVFLDRQALDLSRPVTDLPPASGVILAAAYTAVDDAQNDTAMAHRVNGDAVGEIAGLCAARGVPLVHISTDYVFSGISDHPWRPADTTAPINVYGRSKRAGEVAVLASGGTAAVLRTSWVFSAHGRNFMTTMLRLGQSRDTVRVVDDQIGRPTYAGYLADATLATLDGLQADPSRAGFYHVSGTGDPVNWADFARAIFRRAAMDVTVEGIPSADYPTPAARPAYSVLDTTRFEATFSHRIPLWSEGLDAAWRDHLDGTA